VLVLGLLVALAARLPLSASLLLVGGFALCHGYAHGAEMASDASLLRYGLGVLLVTAALHAAGIGCARVLHQSMVLRLGGAAIAASGLLLLSA
jgi:urease accessory protein